MKNGMIRIGMFEAYLERMLIRGIRAAYISYFTPDVTGGKGDSKYDVHHRAEHNLAEQKRTGEAV